MLTLIALLFSPAHASVDFEIKAPATVTVFVDGRRAAYTSRFRQRVSDLEPGTHEVRVASVLGKTLYEDQIELSDGTRTTGEWTRGELVISTEPEPATTVSEDEPGASSSISNAEAVTAVERPDDGVPEEAKGGKVAAILAEEEARAEVAEAPVEDAATDFPEEPEVALAEAAAESIEPEAVPEPTETVAESDVRAVHGPPAGPPASLPLAVPVEAEVVEATLFEPPFGEVEEVLLPDPEAQPDAVEPRSISVQAPPGVAVEVIHSGQVVRVFAEEGRLYVVDARGVRIDLGPASP